MFLFEVFGVIVDGHSSDLFSSVLLLPEILLVFIIFLVSIFLSSNTSFSLVIDLILDRFIVVFISEFLELFVLLQDSIALALHSCELVENFPVLFLRSLDIPPVL